MAISGLNSAYYRRVSTRWGIGSHDRCSSRVLSAINSRQSVALRRQTCCSSRSRYLGTPLVLQPPRASTAPDRSTANSTSHRTAESKAVSCLNESSTATKSFTAGSELPAANPPVRPASPGWFQDLLGAATAAATGNQQQQQQQQQGIKREPGSPAAAPPGLPLPLLWELPKAFQQLATRSQSPSAQQPTAAAGIRGLTGLQQSTVTHRSSSPSQQIVLARALASSLRHLQPRPVNSSNTGLQTPAAAPAMAVTAGVLDATTLQLIHVLQQLRGAVSDEAWEGFVDGVQLQAADALQLTVVETAVSASIADDDIIYDEILGLYGDEDPIAVADAAAPPTAAAASEMRGLATMSMSGRHMITQLPAVSSKTATTLHKQHKQQCRRQRMQQPSAQQDEEQQVEGKSKTAAAAVAAVAAEEQLKHQVASKLQTLRGQLKQYTEQHHQQQQQQQQTRAVTPGNDVTGTSNDNLSKPAAAQTTEQPQQQISTSLRGPAVATASTDGDITSSSSSSTSSPKYEYLVFGGGGARCFGYAGALHALRQLGLLGRLKGVSGSSGGAVYALLAALRFSVSEVQAAMGTLPETESLSWLRLNSRLGLSDGEATFRQIEAAIATKLGIPHPSLADVAAAAGCPITLAATSLARRAPVYLSSTTHPDMPVRDALRASCAIPFFFTPLRVAGSSSSSSSAGVSDLLVDGCITDCTPLAGLSVGGGGWDPSRTLVLAVHDAAGLESPDFQGLLSGLISTVMQAGIHHTLAAGIDLLNLWPAVAGVNPLQFRMPGGQARDVIARSQALAEDFAVTKMKQYAAAAAAAARPSVSGSAEYVNSVLAGMGSSSSGSKGAAADVVDGVQLEAREQSALQDAVLQPADAAAAEGSSSSSSRLVTQRHLMEGGHQAMAGMMFDSIADEDQPNSSSSGSSQGQCHLVGYDSYLSYDNGALSDDDWDESDLAGFRGWEEEGEDDEEVTLHSRQQQHQQVQHSQQQHLQGSRAPTEGVQWLAGLDGAGLAGMFTTAAAAAAGADGQKTTSNGTGGGIQDLSSRWLGRFAIERLLRAALMNVRRSDRTQQHNTQGDDSTNDNVIIDKSDSVSAESPSTILASHLSESEWRMIEEVLQQQEEILQQQERALAAARQQQQEQSAGSAAAESCGLAGPKELVIVEHQGISQVCLVTTSMEEQQLQQQAPLHNADSGSSGAKREHGRLAAAAAAAAGANGRASLSSLASVDRDCVFPIISSMEEQSLYE